MLNVALDTCRYIKKKNNENIFDRFFGPEFAQGYGVKTHIHNLCHLKTTSTTFVLVY